MVHNYINYIYFNENQIAQSCIKDAKRIAPTVVIQLETIQLIHEHAHNDVTYKPRQENGKHSLKSKRYMVAIDYKIKNMKLLLIFLSQFFPGMMSVS